MHRSPRLLDEADVSMTSFPLSVLGQGSFLILLEFLGVHAPDPVLPSTHFDAVTGDGMADDRIAGQFTDDEQAA